MIKMRFKNKIFDVFLASVAMSSKMIAAISTTMSQAVPTVEPIDKAITLPKDNRDGDKEFEMHMLDGYV